MARKASRKKTTRKAPKKASSATQQDLHMTETPGNLEQIRDILFGGQMRDLDKRFARIEERLQKDLSRVRDDISKSLASLESFTKQELAAMSDRLKAEQKDRAGSDKELTQGLKDLGRNLDKRITKLDEGTGSSIGELREQVLETSKSLREETQARYDELSEELAREVGDLRGEKVSTSDVAALFAEMAMRLGDGGGKGGKKGK